MKGYIGSSILVLLFAASFAQQFKFEYAGRFGPSIKKEKLGEAKFISEIMPEFSRFFVLPFKERVHFDEQLKLASHLNDSYVYPQEFYSRQTEDYMKVISFSDIELFTVCNGRSVSAKSGSQLLTKEQKMILNAADFGTEVRIKIRFEYKSSFNPDGTTRVSEGEYVITVVPQVEAEFPGGFKQLTSYITEHIINKIPGNNSFKKIQQAKVEFVVNEEGKPIDVKLTRSANDSQIDKLVLEAITRMPKWRPAKDVKGVNIKQLFSIPFGGDGC